MAWIELHQSLPTHRKTLALADALNIEPVQAVGHLCCLWLWTLDNAPGGALLDVSSRTIARAAHWRKDATMFVLALVEAGFLDPDQRVHDWDEYTWRLLEGRDENKERARDRQRRFRERHRTNALREGDGNALVTRDSHTAERDGNRATVPNPTVPNPTVPDLRKPPPSADPLGRAKRAKPAHQELTQPERTELIVKWQDEYGGLTAVSEEIDAALNHTARLKCVSERLYVDNWLRRGLQMHRKNNHVSVLSEDGPRWKQVVVNGKREWVEESA